MLARPLQTRSFLRYDVWSLFHIFCSLINAKRKVTSSTSYTSKLHFITVNTCEIYGRNPSSFECFRGEDRGHLEIKTLIKQRTQQIDRLFTEILET